MLVPANGLILAALVFKANCTGAVGDVCVPGNQSVIAFLVHCVVASILMYHVVPLFSSQLTSVEDDTAYELVARQFPRSWFSCNPVHCLRSKYLHKFEPPCMYACRGK